MFQNVKPSSDEVNYFDFYLSGQELGHWKEDRAGHWRMSDLVK